MRRQEYQDKLRSQLAEWQQQLEDLRPLANKAKQKDESPGLERGITGHEVFEAMQNSVKEAEAQVASLNDIVIDAWEKRGPEIRKETEAVFREIEDRFQSLSESLKKH